MGKTDSIPIFSPVGLHYWGKAGTPRARKTARFLWQGGRHPVEGEDGGGRRGGSTALGTGRSHSMVAARRQESSGRAETQDCSSSPFRHEQWTSLSLWQMRELTSRDRGGCTLNVGPHQLLALLLKDALLFAEQGAGVGGLFFPSGLRPLALVRMLVPECFPPHQGGSRRIPSARAGVDCAFHWLSGLVTGLICPLPALLPLV